MKIAVLGAGGHVGLVTAATLSKLGHTVVGQDIDEGKIGLLKKGQEPFYEPGQQTLLTEGLSSGRLTFTLDPEEAIPDSDVAFLCVWTNIGSDGFADLTHIEDAATAVGKFATRDMVVVSKSTVPVQTAGKIQELLKQAATHSFVVVSNPEFLREGKAVEDSINPDRILVGADTDHGHEIMREVYAPLIAKGLPYFATTVATAELAKHASNAFLALKISFANALARICEAASADVVDVTNIMGADPRIGPEFLNAGLGYGGYCFPKDIPVFEAQVETLGYKFPLLNEIVRINHEALIAAFKKIENALKNLHQKRIVLLGLAYKPFTDDLRESPALKLGRMLLEAGALVAGYDPKANDSTRREFPELQIFDDPYLAAENADCLVICTEWPEFSELDLPRLKTALSNPLMVDTRNVFEPSKMADAGFVYIPTGRPPTRS